VTEVMKAPFAVSSLAQLQKYSQGTVDHSVNVGVLSVYLAMQMGYSHTLILQHVGLGALLHDLGKSKITIDEGESDEAIAEKLEQHPELGMRLIEQQSRVPNEVKMIIAQHHECADGSGFPKGLRGSQIYDLARIVAIANTFDELVADGQGTLQDRQRAAIQEIDQNRFMQFDPQKLDKALKILKLGV
jgi:putative nucleotidyltransferase with HDIG domain